MDSLELIRCFREVADRGNFSLAARRLGVSKAKVSKAISLLEDRFGVRLLHRSTRSVSITDAGQLLRARSDSMLELIEVTKWELSERASKPRGLLRIAAPAPMASGTFPDLLAEFMGYYPEVNIALLLANSVDLVDDAIDVQLSIGPIEDVNFIVRRLSLLRMVVCASPPYWEKHGKPGRPDELGIHDALTLVRSGINPAWHFVVDGEVAEVKVHPRMSATEVMPLIQIALHDYGVIYVPASAVQSHLESGHLVSVLDEFTRRDIWLSAAYAQHRHNSAAQRALLDFLQSRLGSQANVADRSNKGALASHAICPQI